MILVLLAVLSIFSHSFTSVSCLEVGLFLNNTHSSWSEFSVDLKTSLKFTKSINIIEGVHESMCENDYYMVRDFEVFLIKYLQKKRALDVVIVSPSLEDCSDENCNNKQERKIQQGKKVYFMIYESLTTLSHTLNTDRWSIFNKSSASIYMVIALTATLEEASCGSNDTINILKDKVGYIFAALWSKYKTLSVFMLLPQFCSSYQVLKYNPLNTCSEGDCSDLAELLSVEDFSEGKVQFSYYITNFRKFPLKINIFERSPTFTRIMQEPLLESYLKKDVNDVGYGGMDGFFLGNMVQRMNFTPILMESADNQQYGSMLENGSFTGSMGDVLAGLADISVNSRFMRLYGTDDIAFTYPIASDEFCLIAPKASRIPYWSNMFYVFSPSAWYLIVCTMLLLAVLWWLWTRVSSEGRSDGSYWVMMEILLVFVNKPILLPTMTSERIFIATCLFLNILFATIFQGYLTTAYSTTAYNKDINTLRQVDRSGMKIGSSPSIGDLFGDDASPLTTSLKSKIIYPQVSVITLIEKLRIFGTERKLDTNLLFEVNYTDSEGQPRLHLVKQCPRYFHLSYIVHRNFPFLSNINRFLMRIVTAGLPDFWYGISEYSIILHHRYHRNLNTKGLRKLSLTDVQTAFYFLISGLVVSSVVFVCEVFWFLFHRRVRREGTLLEATPEYPFVP